MAGHDTTKLDVKFRTLRLVLGLVLPVSSRVRVGNMVGLSFTISSLQLVWHRQKIQHATQGLRPALGRDKMQ